MTLTEYLVARDACDPSIPWVAGRPASEALWRECPDASWMLWLCAKVGVRRELLVLCATGCARSVLHLMPRGDGRPRLAVEVAEAWAYGRATLEDVRAAVHAAYVYVYAACADADPARAAAYAAYAGRSACAACATYVFYTANDAATAAAHAAAYAAARAGICTREHALARYARGVRDVVPWWHVADRLVAAGVEVER